MSDEFCRDPQALLEQLISKHSEERATESLTAVVQKRSAVLHCLSASLVAQRTDFAAFTEWIGKERLEKIPSKGGEWDVCLIRATRVGESLHGLEGVLEANCDVSYGRYEIELALGYLLLLLKVSLDVLC